MEIDKTNIILNNDGSIYHLGLFPNEINDIIFTVGDPDRVKFVSRHFNSINLKKQKREFLKIMCDIFQIPTNDETLYVEDICKNLTSETAKNMVKVWFSNDEPINDEDKYKDVIDYKIDNLALFLKKIRLLKENK